MGSPASAITPAPVCGGTTCTVTFSTAGTGQTWVVPAGVTSESITLYGAIGGSTNIVLGGDGAKVTGTLALSPGTSVTVDVGGAGTDGASAGINGGGASELGTGGGGSDVKVAGVDQLAAGGGGGAGNPEGGNVATQCPVSGGAPGGAGGNADTAGVAGTALVVEPGEGAVTLNPGDGGGAGTMSGGAGGAGGTASAATDCNGATVDGSVGGTGSSNQGGAGGITGVDGLLGGGGGGGYFGGGGGGGASTDPAGNFPALQRRGRWLFVPGNRFDLRHRQRRQHRQCGVGQRRQRPGDHYLRDRGWHHRARRRARVRPHRPPRAERPRLRVRWP